MPEHDVFLNQYHEWQATALADALREDEQNALNKILPHFFGYYLLQVSIAEEQFDLSASPIHRQFYVNDDTTLPSQAIVVRALAGELPFQSNSIDVVLIPHVLEFISDPHVILREACRVVIPEGHIVILGFNPFSLWGLSRFTKRRHTVVPWGGNFISSTTVQNWLTAYDFEIVRRENVFYRPAWYKPENLIRSQFLERLGKKYWPKCGASHILFAKKKVLASTLLKQKWKKKHTIKTTNGVIETCQRKMNERKS